MTQIKNLMNKEEVLEMNIHNIGYQIDLYISKLNSYISTAEEEEKIVCFRSTFEYYKNHLIPALQEMVKLGEKNINIISLNPEREYFQPIRMQIEAHQQILDGFFHRFSETHDSFEAFINKTGTKPKSV